MPDRNRARPKAGNLPRLAVYIQFLGRGRGAGAEPHITFRLSICSGVSLLRIIDVR